MRQFMSHLNLAILIGASTFYANATAAEAPKEMLLWPAGHAANQGDEPKKIDSAEWTERVTVSPKITPFLPEAGKGNGAAIVICPGGGYSGLAMQKEGLEVAEWLRSRGIAGIVLRYRCGGGKNQQPVPLEDAKRAIRTVRSRAAEWGVDPQRVGILGFSAGGHLASTAATMFDAGKPESDDPVERQSSRPDFAVLVYPVITLVGEAGHRGSRNNLLGADASEALAETWSTDRRVTDKTPPTFLVHAGDDKGVTVENSLLFYKALVANGVPAELHVYETGGHGFGMFREQRPADKWPEQLEPWLASRGLLAPKAK
jgi:acetyl esterase/lipase